jgi:hypothetical protein
MTPPVFTVKTDDRRLVLQFERLPLTLKTNLTTTITTLTDQLRLRVRAAEPRRTGRLQLETRSFVDVSETAVRGRVRVLGPSGAGPNIAAAALEYGAHQRFQVRAYQRAGGSIAVSAYTRRANIAARRFLRGPAEAMHARILAELTAAVDQSVKDASQ